MALVFEHLTFDAAHAGRLATFWAAALGWDVAPGATEELAALSGPPSILFLRVPEAKTAKNRLHPDFLADDLEEEVARLVGLGATRLADREEWGARWATLADPEGNEFDVVQRRG